MKTIRLIKNEKIETPKKIRVCVYGRVSTMESEQEHSLQLQIEHYTKKYKNDPMYEFVGAFADRGISGRRTDRPGFNAMLNAARNGEIDLIICKSVSRFARNSVYAISVVRELRELGIDLLFETEHLSSKHIEFELFFHIIASIAEEESRNIGENLKWSHRKRYKEGKPIMNIRIYGYDKEFNIIEDEAKNVRRIYKLYLDGFSIPKIVKIFNEENVSFLEKWEGPWNISRVSSILHNEKYKGSVLMQKETYIWPTRAIKNKGYEPQYYIEDNHEPIVGKEIWQEVHDFFEKGGYMSGRNKATRKDYPHDSSATTKKKRK